MAVTGGLACLGVVIACSVFLFVHYRDARRLAQGDSCLATAQTLAKTGKLPEALIFARRGVAQSPANRDGRLLLSQLFIADGRADSARQVLLDGLPFHRGDPIYLHPLFSFLLQRQEDTQVVALARALLRHPLAATDANRLIALAAATASYLRGNYDQADDFLRLLPTLAQSRDGRLLATKIDWDRGFHDLALLQLRALADQCPDDIEIHATLAAQLRVSGLADEARRLSLAFQLSHPDLPGPRLELLNAYQLSGDSKRVAQEAAAFMRDFAANPAALLALANFAANNGNATLARQLAEHARVHRFPVESHTVLVAEALIVSHDYHAALELIRALTLEKPSGDAPFKALLAGLQAVAHYGLGDTEAARLFLASSLSQPQLRAENLLAISRRLNAVGAEEPARQTLLHAVAIDPLNQAAVTRLVELDLNLNRIDELPPHLRRLLTMRRPSPAILRVAQYKLGSDLFLFSAERPAVLEAVRLALQDDIATLPRS